jgi:putative Mg2+ transporter-C (MgtC) family protein
MGWEVLTVDLKAEVLLRIAAALAAGLVIGAEREVHGRAAGLRTTMLVCLSSCVAMLVSEMFYQQTFGREPSQWHPDPMRLAAGILTGMGFLGAGVIIQLRTNVIRGVTTAATLWLTAIVGIAIGGGALGIGLLATVLTAVILAAVPKLEAFLENDWYSDLSIQLEESASADEVAALIRSHGVKITGIDWKEKVAARRRTVTYHLKLRKSARIDLPARIIAELGRLPGTRSVHWHG